MNRVVFNICNLFMRPFYVFIQEFIQAYFECCILLQTIKTLLLWTWTIQKKYCFLRNQTTNVDKMNLKMDFPMGIGLRNFEYLPFKMTINKLHLNKVH